MSDSANHQMHIIALSQDIDELQHVNNIVYLNWVQEVAKEHWKLRATPVVFNTYKWVVVNHNITYKKSVKLGDEVLIKTQVSKEVKGALWGRAVWIFDSANILVAEANTQWCLVDAQSLRPKRITQEIISTFINNG